MKKFTQACIVTLGTILLVGTVNIPPSFSDSTNQLLATVKPAVDIPFSGQVCKVLDFQEVELGNFIVTLPPGELAETKEQVNGSIVPHSTRVCAI
jgi:hypothetical protein